jgi:hypothetical protein
MRVNLPKAVLISIRSRAIKILSFEVLKQASANRRLYTNNQDLKVRHHQGEKEQVPKRANLKKFNCKTTL